jgi:hypothetical protein
MDPEMQQGYEDAKEDFGAMLSCPKCRAMSNSSLVQPLAAAAKPANRTGDPMRYLIFIG